MWGSTAACSEADGGWLPTDFSPTSRLPSQFLPASRCHRSFLRLPQVPGGPSGRAGAPAAPAPCSCSGRSPSAAGAVLFALPAGEAAVISPVYRYQVSLLDSLCHMPVRGQMAGGRRRAGEEMWQADGVNIPATFPRETRLKRSSLLPGHYVKELCMRNAVCDLLREPVDIYTVI